MYMWTSGNAFNTLWTWSQCKTTVQWADYWNKHFSLLTPVTFYFFSVVPLIIKVLRLAILFLLKWKHAALGYHNLLQKRIKYLAMVIYCLLERKILNFHLSLDCFWIQTQWHFWSVWELSSSQRVSKNENQNKSKLPIRTKFNISQ